MPVGNHRLQMTMRRNGLILLSGLLCLIAIGTAAAESSGEKDYRADCARCHGIDGKGSVPTMRMVPGYVSVDLTQLSKNNNGKFPHQRVYDAIDGRKRVLPHFIGDMPAWGLKYRQNRELSPQQEKKIERRISALVDYIESLQEK
jgi:mono/diheme cytochrome c family protein